MAIAARRGLKDASLPSLSLRPGSKNAIQGQPEKTGHLLIFAGPGGTAFDRGLALKMADNIGANDHSCDVFQYKRDNDEFGKCIEALKRDTSARPSLLVCSHGKVEGRGHQINLDGNYSPTGRLFDKIAVASNRPVDVFLTACHGGAALKDAHRLPPGSAIAVIAPAHESVSSVGVGMLVRSMKSMHSLDAKSLLLTYCSTLNNRFPPSFWSDGCTYSLNSMMKARLGRTFSTRERQLAHAALAHLLPSERIDEVMGKIENARHEFDGIDAIDYGPSLAIVGTLDLPGAHRTKEEG